MPPSWKLPQSGAVVPVGQGHMAGESGFKPGEASPELPPCPQPPQESRQEGRGQRFSASLLGSPWFLLLDGDSPGTLVAAPRHPRWDTATVAEPPWAPMYPPRGARVGRGEEAGKGASTALAAGTQPRSLQFGAPSAGAGCSPLVTALQAPHSGEPQGRANGSTGSRDPWPTPPRWLQDPAGWTPRGADDRRVDRPWAERFSPLC